jgi:hypothetical protein
MRRIKKSEMGGGVSGMALGFFFPSFISTFISFSPYVVFCDFNLWLHPFEDEAPFSSNNKKRGRKIGRGKEGHVLMAAYPIKEVFAS